MEYMFHIKIWDFLFMKFEDTKCINKSAHHKIEKISSGSGVSAFGSTRNCNMVFKKTLVQDFSPLECKMFGIQPQSRLVKTLLSIRRKCVNLADGIAYNYTR